MFNVYRRETYSTSAGTEFAKWEPEDLGEFETLEEAREAVRYDIDCCAGTEGECPRFTCRDCLTRWTYEVERLEEDEDGYVTGETVHAVDPAFDLVPWTHEAYLKARQAGLPIADAFAWADSDEVVEKEYGVEAFDVVAPFGVFTAMRDWRPIIDGNGELFMPRDPRAGRLTPSEALAAVDRGEYLGYRDGTNARQWITWSLLDQALCYSGC